jgi:hypothetical protein
MKIETTQRGRMLPSSILSFRHRRQKPREIGARPKLPYEVLAPPRYTVCNAHAVRAGPDGVLRNGNNTSRPLVSLISASGDWVCDGKLKVLVALYLTQTGPNAILEWTRLTNQLNRCPANLTS